MSIPMLGENEAAATDTQELQRSGPQGHLMVRNILQYVTPFNQSALRLSPELLRAHRKLAGDIAEAF